MLTTLKRQLGLNPLKWLAGTRRLREQLRSFDAGPLPPPGAPRFAIVVTPWLGTWIPWYSLAVGLLLGGRGNAVSFLLDSFPFGANRLRHRFVLACLRAVLRRVPPRFAVIDLGRHGGGANLDAGARASIAELARLNAVWEMRGEMNERGRQAFTAQCVRQLGAAHNAIAAQMRRGAYDMVFVPGGVFGSSGLWTRYAAAAGIRLGSYDTGGYGTVMIACNGVACQLQDIPAAVALLQANAGADELAFAMAAAQAAMARRRAGVDTFESQVKGGGGGDSRYDGAVLLALNSSWDSAALGLHAVFSDNTQWIVQTTRELLDHTQAAVIVRQHPAERLEIARTSDDYAALLREHFGAHPRLHFIAAAEPVNSYELFKRVAAVVVYTSTIGIEAAAHGLPVITASKSYYAGMGFVWQATSLAEYQGLLRQAAGEQLKVSAAMRDAACLCYYMTQCCNWVFSPFNPADFEQWSRLGLAQLQADATVQGLLKSLQDGVPVAYLNHLGALAKRDTALATLAPIAA